MTLYCQILDELPYEQMAKLRDDCDFSVQIADGRVQVYRYEWPDLRISVGTTLAVLDPSHLQGLLGYARNLARARGVNLDAALVRRILETRLVMGFVVEP